MIPKNNKEKFVKKYGNWWFLRDLDFLVENLADCGYNMTQFCKKMNFNENY